MPIEYIDSSSAKLIYAGQHVYNVPTLIKELVENSIDASSKNVWVSIEEKNELEYIEVADDGDGIKPKNNDGTKYGYKGEALNCILQCSNRIEIHSRNTSDVYGRVLKLNDQGELELNPKAREKGTSIKIERPFAKFPVRLTEWKRNRSSHMKTLVKILKNIALLAPLRIVLSIKGREESIIFSSNGYQSMRERAKELFGFQIEMEKRMEIGDTNVHIYLGLSERKQTLTYWNNRPINNQVKNDTLTSLGC